MADKPFRKTFELGARDKTGPVFSRLSGRFQQLKQPMDHLNNRFRTGVQNMTPMMQRMERFGSGMQEAGKKVSLAIGVPATAAGISTVAIASDFELSMKKVGVLSRSTEEQLLSLRGLARDIGAQTQFSSGAAAEGMGQLAVSGFSPWQIRDAIRPVMDLSAAADMELGESADIASNIMTSFGFEAEKSRQIVDKLSFAFSRSANRLTDLGEAYRLAGGVAAAYGVDFETVTSMLMALGNVGHRGASAGMAVQGALNRVVSFRSDMMAGNAVGKVLKKYRILPSVYLDKEDHVRLPELLEELERKKVSNEDFKILFGEDYSKYLVSLRKVSDELRKNTDILRNPYGIWKGSAQRIASVYMDGATGAINSFKSATADLVISVADSGLLSGFTRATNMLSDLIRSLSDSSPAAMRYATLGIGTVTAAATGAVVLGGVSQLVATALSGIATGLTAGTVFTMLAGGGAFVAAGLGIASYAAWWYDQNRKEIEQLSDEFGAWLKKKVAEEQGMEQALWEGLVSLWEFKFPSFRDVRNYAAELAESSGLSVLSELIKEDFPYRPDPSFHLNLPMRDPGVSPDYVSPMKEQQGFIWNPIRDRRYFQLEYQPKKLQLFAPDTAKKEEKKEISLLFRFDEMPDFMKSPEISAPHELRIHKEVRRSFKGLYG